MAQNRKPPAYQEYAATMLASRNFRLMNIAERGLLYTIRLECWENKQVPSSINQLAKYLGCDESEIQTALTDRVKSFFQVKDGSFTCAELEDYRQHLAEIRLKQIEGGKKGAKKTNSIKNEQPNSISASEEGKSQLPRQDGNGSLVQFSPVQKSQRQPIERGNIDNSFVTEMNEYERLSNGL